MTARVKLFFDVRKTQRRDVLESDCRRTRLSACFRAFLSFPAAKQTGRAAWGIGRPATSGWDEMGVASGRVGRDETKPLNGKRLRNPRPKSVVGVKVERKKVKASSRPPFSGRRHTPAPRVQLAGSFETCVRAVLFFFQNAICKQLILAPSAPAAGATASKGVR